VLHCTGYCQSPMSACNLQSDGRLVMGAVEEVPGKVKYEVADCNLQFNQKNYRRRGTRTLNPWRRV
jgi:hypothetical protein